MKSKIYFLTGLTIEPFDNLEVHPVKEIDQTGTCEACEPADADFWSVYVHLKAGGVQCIADLPTEALAKDLEKLIIELTRSTLSQILQ